MILSFLSCVLLITAAKATPTAVLAPGDIQIVAYAADEPDAFAFVTWVDILAGTEIFFTDEGWACDGFYPNESIIRYTASALLPAGSVQSYQESVSQGPDWFVVKGSVSWSGTGDQLIVYQGTHENPTPIFAFDTTGGWEDCASVDSSVKSAVPTGLVDGVSAVSFDHSDNFWYRPWYSRSATLATMKEWMVNRNRFKTTSASATRLSDYEVPSSFTILSGERGTNGWTEYIPGTAPCIILSGHDGDVYPDSIVDRNHGCLVNGECVWDKVCAPQDEIECRAVVSNDENTQDMARRAVDIFEGFSGGRCHLVVNRLGRSKLDPNREQEEAAQFDPQAIQAYTEFHDFASQARATITSSCGRGLVLDFHGHVHPEARVELGYKLSSALLREDDAFVDGLAYTSSIKNMPTHTGAAFSTVIRGLNSMGELFERATSLNVTGYKSVPSPTTNAPGVGESYFQGGYNIETHGSQYGGTIDADYLRADFWDMQDDMLTAFGEVVLPDYLQHQYLFDHPGQCQGSQSPGPTPGPTPGP
eukprot:CAMPEP_0117016780 /NCGR_PEP_ID=MMETSP0472-20121206/13198_1 /TAXON_ID=693140 ORGANISM="Tiarina fusus, Strain LIS" /NCGR_SAMPLE_ID=MMETSP0472 /ASSEMBLY_ACC=CAM_ASM_000603 /LENGTH=531 /DNA_ID=CAMNT_0004720967 /DNA_START=91 /DNA_END=1682 /DNA_ORIENTATION=-